MTSQTVKAGTAAEEVAEPPTSQEATTLEEETETNDFYLKCRGKIEHEDALVNHRLTWLMTLQGLLFTAYGFSMSGEAGSLGAKGLDENASAEAKRAYDFFSSNLLSVRQGLVALGILSSIAALIGVLAAFRAIKDDEDDLRLFPPLSRKGKKLYPKVIGSKSANFLGMLCGVSLPFLTAGGWIWVGNLQGSLLITWISILGIALLLTVLYTFTKVLPR